MAPGPPEERGAGALHDRRDPGAAAARVRRPRRLDRPGVRAGRRWRGPEKTRPGGPQGHLAPRAAAEGRRILYDGLDQIVSQASLADVIRFLRKANDMAFVHGMTVIARVSPGVLADSELRRLNAEFDEFLDLSA